MGLKAILNAVFVAGGAQAHAIEVGSITKSREILAGARAEALQIEDQAFAVGIAPADKERARVLQRARLEALRLTGEAREALIDIALERTRGRLAHLRAERNYPEVLGRLTCEALAELGSSLGPQGQPCLEADPRDRETLEDILQKMELQIPVRYELNCWGGLIAKSQDERVTVINTMETRLERATPYLRHALAALFEDEQISPDLNRVVETVMAS